MRLADTIGRWLGRVEVVLAGADETLADGERALANDDAMAARAAARSVLDQLPGSPLGLALLADACEMAGLEAELALTLEELAAHVARADVWVRLGRARQATGEPLAEVRDAFLRALAVAEPGSDARREALIALADLDIAQNDGARAELWLDRVASDKAPDVAARRAEAKLVQGDVAGARTWLARFEESPTDARAARVRGQALMLSADKSAFGPLLRAVVLDAPGASDLLASALAWIPTDPAMRERVRVVVDAKGEAGLARWRAAFARAEGRRDEARQALRDAVTSGDATAARPLLDAALEDRDYDALASALAALSVDMRAGTVARDAALLPSPAVLADPTKLAPALDAIAGVTDERVLVWADDIREEIARAWLPKAAPARWNDLLARLDTHARELHDLDATQKIAAIAAERARPVRLAIVGEFNAGKSTFINALMGADIAPTGVLPTTATLHHLRYAPDPIARILLKPTAAPEPGPLERLVAVGDLQKSLKSIDPKAIRRVEILLPIASLTRVEILDTPGFNAPDARHAEAARAAFEEADACLWLFDAAQPLKQTERAVLEEAQAAGLPIQILVNKVDRLAPDDVVKVIDLVGAALTEIGIASWSPPVPFSARLALAGKLGDAAALVRSGWERVEALLETEILARSDELKERSLRRRAAIVVGELTTRAGALAEREHAAAAQDAARAQRMSRAAAAIDRDQEDAVATIAKALAAGAEAWHRDLGALVTGRDANAAESDPILARYRVERALAHLAGPLANALSALSTLPPLAAADPITAADLTPLTRAVVRAFAVTSSSAGAEVTALARAAVPTLVEHLGALAIAPTAPMRVAGQVRELAAFERAFRPARTPHPP